MEYLWGSVLSYIFALFSINLDQQMEPEQYKDWTTNRETHVHEHWQNAN